MAAAAAIGMIIAAGAAIAKGVSNINQANAEADARELQAREVNIKAVRDEALLRKRGREFAGGQVAGFAASGAASMEGSPLLVLEDTLASIEEEAMAIRHGAEFRAGQLLTSARTLRQRAQEETIATAFGFGGNILTGASQADALNDPKQTGARLDNASSKKTWGSGFSTTKSGADGGFWRKNTGRNY